MLSSKQTRRTQRIMVLTTLILAAYYLLLFRPLAQRAEALDQPLILTWKKLADAKINSNSNHELNLAEMAKQLQQVRTSVTTLQKAGQLIEASVALDAATRAKMREPFQLVDFQIEELLRIEELGRAAQQNQVTISPSVFSSFPEYRGERGEPELLWGQLAFLDQLISMAIRCRVSSIQSIDLPSYTSHAASTNNAAFLYEIPVRLELIGSMESISKLLASLPLRAETKMANLPEAPATKPAMFIHRFILTKNSPENPEEAHLDLRASGFIYRD